MPHNRATKAESKAEVGAEAHPHGREGEEAAEEEEAADEAATTAPQTSSAGIKEQKT